MVEKKPEEQHWTEKASSNLEYYLDTEEGRKELSEMIKKETELQLKQIFTSKQGLKEIIWLSKYCDQCTHFTEGRRSMKCAKFKKRKVEEALGKEGYYFF